MTWKYNKKSILVNGFKFITFLFKGAHKNEMCERKCAY